MRLMLIMAVAVMLTGCSSYLKVIEGLNERQIQSCLRYDGAVSAGIVFGANGALRGVTATGGADIAMCPELLD